MATGWLFPRFIPARAGNIADLAECCIFGAVHPRTCGEHVQPLRRSHHRDGSSPHVRGTSTRKKIGAAVRRFIPARAGNINNSDNETNSNPVHPRTCGEHSLTYFSCVVISGSSPHVRGTYGQFVFGEFLFRFIPARAGNIPHLRYCRFSAPVHPRTCGEH